MDKILEVVRRGRVQHLTMQRPEKRNALNAELCAALAEAIEEADRDPAVGAIVLTGAGTSFCAGMDLSEVGPGGSDEMDRVHEQLFTVGARITTPLIGGVTGPALGGGLGLVANCHVVVASAGASFGLTEIRLGLWPFLVYRAVSAAMGERRTVELALTGRIFGAEEGRMLGLVHEIAVDPVGEAQGLAEGIAGFSPTSIRSGLAFVQEVRGMDWKRAGEVAQERRKEVFRTADFQEGLAAFREKRRPKWPSLE